MFPDFDTDLLEHEAIESGEALVEHGMRLGGNEQGLTGACGEATSIAELFDSLAGYCGNAMQRHFRESFDIVAAPGEPLHGTVEPGDILLTRPLAEGGLARASAVMRAGESEAIDVVSPPLLRRTGRGNGSRRTRGNHRLERRTIVLDLHMMPRDRMIIRIRSGGAAWPVEAEAAEVTLPEKGNDFVRWVQRSLNELLGLNLVVDGVAGDQTRKAIKEFQSQNNLVVDGMVGSKTEKSIRDALAAAPVSGGAGAVAPSLSSVPCPPPPPLPPKCLGLGAKEVINCFDFASSKVLPRHQHQIVNIARCIVESQKSATPINTLNIVGHTDPVGSDDDNDKLGQKRADAVRDEILATLTRMTGEAGPAVTITTGTRGERDLLPGDPALNRRVEVFPPTSFQPKQPVPPRRKPSVPSKIPVPSRPTARPCCILAPAILPLGTDDNLVDPGALGTHRGSDEAVGLVYTGKAGFVDLGHLRDLCDMTHFVFAQIANAGGAKGTKFKTTGGSGSLSAAVPASSWLKAARSICFDDSVGHEITSYSVFSPGGHNSAFSPEDLCSNFLGTLLAERAITAGGAFDTAVTAELPKLLTSLDAQTKAESLAAFNLINGRWVDFSGATSLLRDDYLKRRNFTRDPFKAGHSSDSATPAFVTAPFGLSPIPYKYTHDEGRAIPLSSYPAEITTIKGDAKKRYGPNFDLP